jgi:hypothetical protein
LQVTVARLRKALSRAARAAPSRRCARCREGYLLAVAPWTEALALNERIEARPALAHTKADLARVLAARDRPGDREPADALRREALYEELGMPVPAPAAG